jgi:hypothetical protein
VISLVNLVPMIMISYLSWINFSGESSFDSDFDEIIISEDEYEHDDMLD